MDNIGCGKKFVAFFPLDGIKCSAAWQLLIASATLDVRLKSDFLNLYFELKKIQIGEVDQKLFYFENGNK